MVKGSTRLNWNKTTNQTENPIHQNFTPVIVEDIEQMTYQKLHLNRSASHIEFKSFKQTFATHTRNRKNSLKKSFNFSQKSSKNHTAVKQNGLLSPKWSPRKIQVEDLTASVANLKTNAETSRRGGAETSRDAMTFNDFESLYSSKNTYAQIE